MTRFAFVALTLMTLTVAPAFAETTTNAIVANAVVANAFTNNAIVANAFTNYEIVANGLASNGSQPMRVDAGGVPEIVAVHLPSGEMLGK